MLTSALSEDNALVEDKINGVIQRERVRELYQKIHDIDIFDCYIGTIVFSALEIIVKLSVLSPIRSYKLYCKYKNTNGVKTAIKKIKIGRLPLKIKIPIYFLKLNLDAVLIIIIKLAKIIGLKFTI